jgi:hypothetical protein
LEVDSPILGYQLPDAVIITISVEKDVPAATPVPAIVGANDHPTNRPPFQMYSWLADMNTIPVGVTPDAATLGGRAATPPTPTVVTSPLQRRKFDLTSGMLD